MSSLSNERRLPVIPVNISVNRRVMANVPLNAILLNRWIMTEILWIYKKRSLGSSDSDDRSLPTWARNASPTSLIGPSVSIATGINMTLWEEERAEYVAIFLSASASAALPHPVTLADRYDVAKLSTTVASHPRQRPLCHGMRVRSSGRRSEPGISHVASWTAGTSARRRARQMTSFNCWWRVERPAIRLQDSPCSSLPSILLLLLLSLLLLLLLLLLLWKCVMRAFI